MNLDTLNQNEVMRHFPFAFGGDGLCARDEVVVGGGRAVYALMNLDTGQCYIGQTSNWPERASQHVTALRYGRHHSKRLQKDFWKMGEQSFAFIVLDSPALDELLARESFWIWVTCSSTRGYNTRYNRSLTEPIRALDDYLYGLPDAFMAARRKLTALGVFHST